MADRCYDGDDMTGQDLKTIRLHPADNVAVAVSELPAGMVPASEGVRLAEPIPRGHKLSVAGIAKGEAVRKYDQIIGFASTDIGAGRHVHTHNVEMGDFARDYRIGEEARPTNMVPEAQRATFQGIVRGDGRVATRNYVGVISTVNCSGTVARYIADHFRGPELKAHPNVDGVVSLRHGGGCCIDDDGQGYAYLRRTLAGFAKHPNFAGVLFVGLGCEVAQARQIMADEGLEPGPLVRTIIIQEAGGTKATVAEGIAQVAEMLAPANDVRRREVPASHLILGMECGGSDAYSGISANPALGAAADLVVRHGGTAVFGETPEIYGAEHLLTRRAVNRGVGEKLMALIGWWEDYAARNGGEMNNNPTPGNKAGGLTTILEKSLGAAAKGGTTNLVDVYGFAERITAKGFVFMDTPGYDPVSITGMIAGGANVIGFTTGRGSVFGCKPAPSFKLATNTPMYERMAGDMDVNCGLVIDGEASVEEMGERIFSMILDIASGDKTKSELLGFGDEEFVPWQIGAVM